MPGAFFISLGYAWTCAAGVRYTKKNAAINFGKVSISNQEVFESYKNAQYFFSSFNV